MGASPLYVFYVLVSIVTLKSLDSTFKDKNCVKLDSHPDTSAVGCNILVKHDHDSYIDI